MVSVCCEFGAGDDLSAFEPFRNSRDFPAKAAVKLRPNRKIGNNGGSLGLGPSSILLA